MDAVLFIAAITAGCVYATAVTWVLYLAVMALIRQKDKLTLPAKVLAYPVALVGITVDFLYNLSVGSLMFIELPHEALFTARLERHMEDDNWRGGLARWFCRNYLDPFDPSGRHCK